MRACAGKTLWLARLSSSLHATHVYGPQRTHMDCWMSHTSTHTHTHRAQSRQSTCINILPRPQRCATSRGRCVPHACTACTCCMYSLPQSSSTALLHFQLPPYAITCRSHAKCAVLPATCSVFSCAGGAGDNQPLSLSCLCPRHTGCAGTQAGAQHGAYVSNTACLLLALILRLSKPRCCHIHVQSQQTSECSDGPGAPNRCPIHDSITHMHTPTRHPLP